MAPNDFRHDVLADRIERDKEYWERHAHCDPLWAILSDSSQCGRKWDLAKFFETGRREISLVLHQMQEVGVVTGGKHALDFGCGVGRLTQALGDHFEIVIGVDISPTMIRLADKLNRRPQTVRYILNTHTDLHVFPNDCFDLVYTDIVLQHIPTEVTIAYLREFVRVLQPGGLVIFQLPSHQRPIAERQRQARPMLPEAYRAELSVTNQIRRFMQPSELTTLIVAVRNASIQTWSRAEHGPMRVGNHWLSGDGTEMLIQDDGRMDLPAVMSPGQVHEARLCITAPKTPQHYTCQLDVVQEGVTWFGDRGSSTTQFNVAVGTAHLQQAVVSSGEDESTAYPDIYADLKPSGEPPDFPMFGVSHDVVKDLMAASGADILLAENDERGGPEWVGYRYFARKRQ